MMGPEAYYSEMEIEGMIEAEGAGAEAEAQVGEYENLVGQHGTIMRFIKEFRDKNGEYFFLHGGCYIFASILRNKFGGVIYSNVDHCVLRKENTFYDITGEVKDGRIKYSTIDLRSELRYLKHENF